MGAEVKDGGDEFNDILKEILKISHLSTQYNNKMIIKSIKT
jgi:hypothetical protein